MNYFVSLHRLYTYITMNKKQLYVLLAAILLVCVIAVVSKCSASDEQTLASPTDDSSQFVTLTDAVPDAILEIRYFGTYNFVGTFDMVTEKEVDMGGTFDWFGEESHPDFCGNPDTGEYTGDSSKSPTGRSITAEQFANRMLLRRAMLSHGFKPLDS